MRIGLLQIYNLTYKDKWSLLKALYLAFFLRIGFKTIGFNATLKILNLFNTDHTVRQPVQLNDDVLKGYQQLVLLTYKFPAIIFNCLAICTTYWWLMKKQGITTHLKFGMLKQNGKLQAHAWLEYNGKIFAEHPAIANKYTAFNTAIL
jgi:hypothetical protein